MNYKLLLILMVFSFSLPSFARCNGTYAHEYIEDIFDLEKGSLSKSDTQSQEDSRKLSTGNLGNAVSEVCMSGCYMPSTDDDKKSCEKNYRIAVQKNISDAEVVLSKKANRTKFIGYCEFSADIAPTNFNAKAYADETNKSCSSSGCLPANITLCRSIVTCSDHPKYASESYTVSCVGSGGECPGVDECMDDTFTQPQDEIKKSKMNFKKSKTSQQ